MEDFTQELVEVLKGMAGPEIRIELINVVKVNDQIAKAIHLFRPGFHVSRNFYPMEYYGEYRKGRKIAEIAGEIHAIFYNDTLRAETEMKLGISDPCDFGRMKRQIYGRLINRNRNQKYLENKCYIKWLDFAICFYIMAENRDNRRTIVDITLDIHNVWGTPKDELLQTSLENLCRDYPAKIEYLSSLLAEYAYPAEETDEFARYMNLPEFPGKESLYVLTNTMYADSAITLFYPNLMRDFADMQGVDKIIIFPSSIHELLLLPRHKGQEIEAEWCSQTIRSINATGLMPEEVLSDHAYLYTRESNQIRIFE